MSRGPLRKRLLCPGCTCGCPCAVTDDFSADSIADYDTTGTFAVAGGVLTASDAGDCFQAIQTPAVGKIAGVSAKVIDNSHGVFGVFIGRGHAGTQSDNRVEWVWDVPNAKCIAKVWVGGVMLLNQDVAGNPVESLKLTMTGTPSAWTYHFYRDGVEVETAGGPANELGWVGMGATSDASGGTWDDLCLISCDSLCGLTFDCQSAVTSPMSWTLNAGAITDGAGNLNGVSGGIDYHAEDCIHCGGEHTLIKESVGYRWDGTFSATHCTAWQVPTSCTWKSSLYRGGGQAPPADCDPAPSSVGGWWASYVYFASPPSEPAPTPVGVTTDGWFSRTVWSATIVHLGGGIYRINAICVLSGKRGETSGNSAIYTSPGVLTGHNYATGGPVTLTFNSQYPPTTDWCNWPSTITLHPNGEGTKFEGAGCLPDSDESGGGAFAAPLAYSASESESLLGPNIGQCQHRGDLIDSRKCETCGNRGKKEPVYQCSLYGECSDWNRFSKVRACRWCQDFTPRSPSPPA